MYNKPQHSKQNNILTAKCYKIYHFSTQYLPFSVSFCKKLLSVSLTSDENWSSKTTDLKTASASSKEKLTMVIIAIYQLKLVYTAPCVNDRQWQSPSTASYCQIHDERTPAPLAGATVWYNLTDVANGYTVSDCKHKSSDATIRFKNEQNLKNLKFRSRMP